MNTTLSGLEASSASAAERQMLRDSARDFVQRGYGDAAREAAASHPHGCLPTHWQQFAELGWLALPLPEAHAGLDGTLADLCALAEELGRGLVAEPFVGCAVLAARLLAALPPSDLRDQALTGLASGERRVAFAAWELEARFDALRIATRANRTRDGWRLDGGKNLTPGGAGADAFIVAARVGDTSAEERLALFLLPAHRDGLHVDNCVLIDGQHAARLVLSGAEVQAPLWCGNEAGLRALVDRALNDATIVHCAETVGTMARAFEITTDYLKTRRQFGRAIADNQVVQHRLVDLYVEIEEARALVQAAAAVAEADDAAETSRHAAAVKAFVAGAARQVWEESVQLHGAIGMTAECAIGPFIKRLAVAAMLYGDAEFQLERLANIALAPP